VSIIETGVVHKILAVGQRLGHMAQLVQYFQARCLRQVVDGSGHTCKKCFVLAGGKQSDVA